MKHFLFLIVTLILVSSCCNQKHIADQNTQFIEKLVTEQVHDTVFVIKADTSHFTADLIVSDSGKISLSTTNITPGEYVRAPKVIIRNNRLSVDCTAEAQRLFKQWKSKHVFETKTRVFTKTKLVEKDLSLWQNFEIWTGRIGLLVCLLGLVGYFLRKRNINLLNK